MEGNHVGMGRTLALLHLLYFCLLSPRYTLNFNKPHWFIAILSFWAHILLFIQHKYSPAAEASPPSYRLSVCIVWRIMLIKKKEKKKKDTFSCSMTACLLWRLQSYYWAACLAYWWSDWALGESMFRTKESHQRVKGKLSHSRTFSVSLFPALSVCLWKKSERQKGCRSVCISPSINTLLSTSGLSV